MAEKLARLSWFGFGASVEIPMNERRRLAASPKASFAIVGVSTLVAHEGVCMLTGVFVNGKNELNLPLMLFLAADFLEAEKMLVRQVTPVDSRIWVTQGADLQLEVMNLGPDAVHFSCVARCLLEPE